jgi:ATP-binding cassette subfamily C protein
MAVAKARARRAAVVIIAHRRGVLETVDRLLVLEEGRLKLLGPAAEVVARLTGPKTAENVA